jgi:hypothetical protein
MQIEAKKKMSGGREREEVKHRTVGRNPSTISVAFQTCRLMLLLSTYTVFS